jgi:hypothetical protein
MEMAVTPKKRAAASARGSTRMAGATLGAMLLCASPSPDGGEEKSGATHLVPLVGSRRADAPRPGAASGRQAPTAPDLDWGREQTEAAPSPDQEGSSAAVREAGRGAERR